MSFKKAALWTLFWFSAAVCFTVGVFHFQGQDKALQFFAGYLIELSLSVDNLFLFLMLFSTYKINCESQRRILNWGIIGAVIMRLIFIVLGIAIVENFHWVLYVFGVILIITGYKMAFGKESEPCIEDNWSIKLLKRFVPVTCESFGDKFFTRIGGVLHATPLFVVLLLIESTDLLFAVDSIPAVFAVTTDPFIVYSSNVLAILGLRSMYFFLERVQKAFVYVKYGVALLLSVTGLKMLLTIWEIKIPVPAALGVIALILAGSVIASVLFGKKEIPVSTCTDSESVD
ncbi:MAG TPA: TerC/Alx family metal homeostasis membrane protein [Desulfobacteria bacterium]|nr:TerC/Alx family metal homeostasis membrane protein [Desulfobacteria bacterium]